MLRNFLNSHKTGIYLISPLNVDKLKFPTLLSKVLATKSVRFFQLRLKNVGDRDIIELINSLYPVCLYHKVPFILNDRVDLVKVTGVDGVHLGTKDLSVKKARKILGHKKIIGSSCYNTILTSMKSEYLGADYLAFGSFFETNTKKDTTKINIFNFKKYRKHIKLPIVAIGGLNKFNIKRLAFLNPDFLAFCSSIWYSKHSPVMEIKKITNIINSNYF